MLRDNLPTYDVGMLEQMSMVYVLKQNPDYIKRLYFEHGYCFNCWYQDLDDPRIAHPAFVIHFAGQPLILNTAASLLLQLLVNGSAFIGRFYLYAH